MAEIKDVIIEFTGKKIRKITVTVDVGNFKRTVQGFNFGCQSNIKRKCDL